jgi:hypothetical protein
MSLRTLACALVLLAPACLAANPDSGSAGALRAKFASLQDKLAYNQFRRPMSLESTETSSGITGDIYALVDHPFAAAAAALASPAEWCTVLILHLNTKYCRATLDPPQPLLHVNIGKKFDQPLSQSYRVDFAYRVVATSAEYLQIRLDAAQGPLGTRDYRIVFEATPAGNAKTSIHLSYSYSYSVTGRIAMQAYLATAGRDKVGFTLVKDGGQPRLIDGLRGAVERNAMRYYLAIDAFLAALTVPREVRLEKSLRGWFASCERYPRQLHEMDQADYLSMKRMEFARQSG